ncbi:hypothetical protein NL108_018328 [Boleophthalmus pectinirostris]|uniref:zinc finger protein 135-like n=1 Tax=Boleophthalmus pectinirostris TaxID=150288 RepID=UPI00242E10F8|nr:zinc finger protein 135-like [Boleophthalmus pectinirostris]KAJ0060006.1 hypothetical protein NL108_018328 [Boleophthalmus pectinirostris]
MDSRLKDVGVQWEPPDVDLDQDLDRVSGLGPGEVRSSLGGHGGHREVGVQCDRTETAESGVQVDLVTQVLSGPSMVLQCVSVRAEGPEGGALLQHCHKPRPRGRPRLNRDQTRTQNPTRITQETGDQTRTTPETQDQTKTVPETKDQLQGDPNRTGPDTEDQTRTKTRTRTREIRPSRRYQDYETPGSPERKRRRGAEEEKDSEKTKATEEDENRTRNDPNWTPRNRAAPQNCVSHDAAVRVKEEAGLVSAGGVVCDVCGKVLKTKSSLSRHALVHSGKQPHSCRFCPLRFNRKDNLRHHLRVMHPNGPAPRVKLRPPPLTWLCHTCGKTFSHRSRLKTHEQIHTGIKPCQCPLCPKAYMRMNDLEHHLKRLHPHGAASPPPPSQLLCHLCGRSFSCKSLLSLHLQKHTGERPHLCHLCGRKFSRKQQLQVHRAAVHPGEGLRPRGEGLLQRGEGLLQPGEGLQREDGEEEEERGEEENGEKNSVVCDVCGRRLRSLDVLETHRMIHSGEKPFQCSICGKSFLRAQTLKQHQLHFHARPQASGPGAGALGAGAMGAGALGPGLWGPGLWGPGLWRRPGPAPSPAPCAVAPSGSRRCSPPT